MIETFKILHGIYDTAVSPVLPRCQEFVTRGHAYKLVKSYSRYDPRKYSFSQRIISLWNSLILHVVNSTSVNGFKSNFDNLWSNQAVYYNFKCDISGTGNRSLCKN